VKVTKRRRVVAKTKASVAVRRSVGWTRAHWINEVESTLVEAFLLFAQATLAGRNGRRRDARALGAEFDRRLFIRLIEIHIHPVKRAFDRRDAFEAAVAEMNGSSIPALRDHVEQEFGEVCQVRRGLDDRNVEAFWKSVTEAARVLTG